MAVAQDRARRRRARTAAPGRPGRRVQGRHEGLRRRLGRPRVGASMRIGRGEFVFLVGPDRLRQVHLHPPADEGARAEPRARSSIAGRTLARDAALARALPAPQHRRRLPGLQAAAEPDRLRQRRLLAPGDRRVAPGDPPQGAGHPAPGRPLHEAPQLPGRAVRRRAAARLDRARVREPPAAAAGRRAHRQPRPRDLDRDHAADLPDQPHRHDRHRGHPRQARWSTRCAGA